MASPLRIGLVGIGDAGAHHAKAALQTPAVALVALCARDADKLAAFIARDDLVALRSVAAAQRQSSASAANQLAASTQPMSAEKAAALQNACLGPPLTPKTQLAGDAEHAVGPQLFTDFAALLQARCVDALILATPDALHASQVQEAAAAGLHVLVEKPLAVSQAAAVEALQAAQRANVALLVGYHLRHHAAHRLMRDELAARVGALRTIFIRWAWPDPAVDGWRARGDNATSWCLSALGTHAIDLALWFAQAAAKHTTSQAVSSSTATSNAVVASASDVRCLRTPANGIDRAAELSFRVGDVLVHVSVSVVHRAVSRVILSGDDGELEATGTLGAHGAGELTWRQRRDITALQFTPQNPYAAQLQHFADACVHGFVADPLLLDDALVMEHALL